LSACGDGQEFVPLTLDKLLPPTRRNLLGRVTCPGVSPTGAPGDDESDLTWAQLSDKMRRERAEHERLRRQDADVIRDVRMSEDLMMQLLDLRAQSFNSERRRLNDELHTVRGLHCNGCATNASVHRPAVGPICYPTCIVIIISVQFVK